MNSLARTHPNSQASPTSAVTMRNQREIWIGPGGTTVTTIPVSISTIPAWYV